MGLIQQILLANFHRGGLKCAHVAEVSPEVLAELQREVSEIAPRGLDSREHSGAWTRPFGSVRQLSLYNRSGDFADRSSDYDTDYRGKKFHQADKFPSLASFIEGLPPLLNLRLNCLGPGSGLSGHEEDVRFHHRLRLRFHLPLFTNAGAEMHLDGEVFHFEAGKIYFFNQGCVHAARNLGISDRYHLVWDHLYNESVLKWMADMTPVIPLKKEKVPQYHSARGYEKFLKRLHLQRWRWPRVLYAHTAFWWHVTGFHPHRRELQA